jgi:signal transduction histidine kinase/HAMP domain-containing protein
MSIVTGPQDRGGYAPGLGPRWRLARGAIVGSTSRGASPERTGTSLQWLPRLVASVPAPVHVKLLLAFLAIVVLLIIVGAVGLQVLSGVNGRAVKLVALQEKIATYRQLQRDASLSPSWFWSERTLEDTLSQLSQLRRDLERLPSAPPHEAETLARVSGDYDRLAELVGRVLELMRARKVPEATTLQLQEAGPLAEHLEAVINKLVNGAETGLAVQFAASQDAYVTSRWTVFGFVAGSIGLALVLGYAISWSLIEPVKRMDASLTLVATGDFTQRVDVPNRDELGALAQEFNRMAASLADSYAALKDRTRALTESLEQQTATSEVLRIFSSSPSDLGPVFDAIVNSAPRLCGAKFCLLYRFDGELVHLVAHHNVPSRLLELLQQLYPMRPGRQHAVGRAIMSGAAVAIEDVLSDPEYQQAIGAITGWRSILAVPMLREGAPIGAIVIQRTEAGPFPEAQVALLETFADEAAIAMENVRLFKELETRTSALLRSVDELTALGDVGRALSSTLDLETVLQTIVTRASELAGAAGCSIYEYDETDEVFRVRASSYADLHEADTLDRISRATPIPRGQGTASRAAVLRQPTQIPDIGVEGAYESPIRGPLLQAGYRAVLTVPLLLEDQVIGALSISRKTPGEFAPETVRLLSTFATQSALAIQNARLFQEIADKSRQLEAASRQKSEFLANMSHELRTPLNAVIGFSEVLLQRMFGELNAKQDEYLKDICASGQHLLSLINDILDLSKIEAGRMELAPAPFHLPTALDNAVTLVKERAARHGITLQLDIDQQLGAVVGDERKVKQVVLNLLSNAVKFTPVGGQISLKATSKDGAVEISVTDTGIGIAPEDQTAIFEEFRQVGHDETRKQEGTGLGLTLAKKFVELHGGRIWVESEPGRGSTFTLTLPVN